MNGVSEVDHLLPGSNTAFLSLEEDPGPTDKCTIITGSIMARIFYV